MALSFSTLHYLRKTQVLKQQGEEKKALLRFFGASSTPKRVLTQSITSNSRQVNFNAGVQRSGEAGGRKGDGNRSCKPISGNENIKLCFTEGKMRGSSKTLSDS